MSQRLHMMLKKDGSAKGVAIRKTKSVENPTTLKAVFDFAYQEHLKRKKNAESKNKTSTTSVRFI